MKFSNENAKFTCKGIASIPYKSSNLHTNFTKSFSPSSSLDCETSSFKRVNELFTNKVKVKCFRASASKIFRRSGKLKKSSHTSSQELLAWSYL